MAVLKSNEAANDQLIRQLVLGIGDSSVEEQCTLHESHPLFRPLLVCRSTIFRQY